MGSLQEKLDANLRKRREEGPWFVHDEEGWLKRHPEDAGTPHYDFPRLESDPEPVAASSPELTEPTEDFDQDLVPELPVEPGDQSDEIEELLSKLGIVAAYQKWCGKSKVKGGTRTESIKVSCPMPSHPDKNPSAWLNTEKNVWHCGACDVGGDIYDIAAFHFGYPVPGYKEGKKFVDLRVEMAGSLGFAVMKKGSTTYVVPVEADESDDQADELPTGAEDLEEALEAARPLELVDEPLETSLPPVERESGDSGEAVRGTASPGVEHVETGEAPLESIAPVLQIRPEQKFLDEAEDIEDFLNAEEIAELTIPWWDFVPSGTFLHDWMTAASTQDIPPEFYLWDGLLMLGMACGRECWLIDSTPVFFNLFIVHYGASGAGKSRSIQHSISLMRDVLPFKEDDDYPNGVKVISGIGSGEALIDAYSKPVQDLSTMAIIDYASVRGLLKFDELESLISQTRRVGNSIRPIIQDMYDGYGKVESLTRGAGHIVALDPFVSSITSTQPKAVKKLLNSNDVDSGFVNRWTFALGPPVRRVSYGGAAMDLTAPSESLKRVRDWADKRGGMILSPGAAKSFDEYFHDVIQPLKSKNDILGRFDLILKKLMGIFAVNSQHEQVQEEDFQQMMRMAPSMLNTYQLLSGALVTADVDDARTRIMAAVNAYIKGHAGKYPSKRDLKRSLASKQIPAEVLEKTLRIMISLEDVHEMEFKSSRGPAKTCYVPNM